jgi:hypothetical protein
MGLLIRSADDEADPPEPHTGIQGESGIGCGERRTGQATPGRYHNIDLGFPPHGAARFAWVRDGRGEAA